MFYLYFEYKYGRIIYRMDGVEMKKIPKKNYIILVLIILATLFLVFFIRDRYISKKEYNSMTNERIDFIFEIKEDELESYLMENREVVIYMASSSDNNVVNFEYELKQYVKEEQLGKEVVYINLNNVSEDFFDKFKDKYFSVNLKASKTELIKQPNMLIVENGKVVSIMYNTNKIINIEDTKTYLNKYVDEAL